MYANQDKKRTMLVDVSENARMNLSIIQRQQLRLDLLPAGFPRICLDLSKGIGFCARRRPESVAAWGPKMRIRMERRHT